MEEKKKETIGAIKRDKKSIYVKEENNKKKRYSEEKMETKS